MDPAQLTKILLVEDDEDDYVLTRVLLSEIPGRQFALDWARNFDEGFEQLCRNEHDVALVDYRLGARNGIELLRAADQVGSHAPVILLTGSGQHQVDMEAMEAGAADYLVKTQIQPNSLERSIRYAVQRSRAANQAAAEQTRLARFGAEVGLALTQRDSFEGILQRCAAAMMQYLNAAVAQIATFDPRRNAFEVRATSATLNDVGGSSAQIPSILLPIDSLASGQPLLIRKVIGDRRFPEQDWAKQQHIVSYAGYPLLMEGHLVGMMSIFARHPLPEQVCQEMGSVAHGISLCIERKRSDEALDASEVKYRSVVENIKEVIFQLDEFGQWTFLNPAWTAVTGFEVDRTIGTFFLEYLHEEEREHNRHIFLQLIERKLEFCRYETRFLTHNGKIRWVEVYAQPSLLASSTAAGLSGSLTDITERKLAENAIQKLAAFPRVNPNPVLEFAADGSLSYANDAARQLVESLGKKQIFEILPADAQQVAREALRSGSKSVRKEVNLQGHTITWSFFPVQSNQVVHCYGADVTEMLSLEAQLRHAQKLESVGQLAAGVAHDFNNVLTVIQGYTETLLSRAQDGASATALRQIADASKRAAALTRQLLMFSRKQVIQTTVLDLNTVLQNVANMLLRLLGEHIKLQTEYGPALPRVEADTGMLEQVVMNLAVNARDAMDSGGTLRIRTESVEIGQDYVNHHPDAYPGQFVCLVVADTGCGMDAHTLDRIFEPFFTTKEVGKGTGLGLATVYGIVKQHRGWIHVDSRVGSGTTFKIYFPALAVEVDIAPSCLPSRTDAVRGGNETIMVVEDEPVLRELVCDVLQGYNYRVVPASSGHEALRTWDEFDGQIDLLLTDMVMPEGMSGRELAAQLKRRKPELKVIYSSGYSPEAMGRDFGQTDTAFLPKPYVPPQLARIVRQALDGHSKRTPKAELRLAPDYTLEMQQPAGR